MHVLNKFCGCHLKSFCVHARNLKIPAVRYVYQITIEKPKFIQMQSNLTLKACLFLNCRYKLHRCGQTTAPGYQVPIRPFETSSLFGGTKLRLLEVSMMILFIKSSALRLQTLSYSSAL